jgi:mono/diheme cytochrome c family protein
MTSKIFVGILVFMIVFAAAGLVLINEGVLDSQQDTPDHPGTGRMQIEARAQQGRSIEAGALLFLNNCVPCHGSNGEGVPGKGPVLNPNLFTKHFPEVKTSGYGGTINDFVKMTIMSGRPIQSEWAAAQGGFAQRMPTWSQQVGGPLRDDQINDLVNFVMNWQAEAAAGPSTSLNFKPVGSDTTTPLPAGDAARGADLFAQKVKAGNNDNLPCAACHSLTPDVVKIGPLLAGIGTRAATREPGKTAEEYIRESIQNPNAFIVPDDPKYQSGGKSIMPAGLGNKMTAQDLADVVAYLASLK